MNINHHQFKPVSVFDPIWICYSPRPARFLGVLLLCAGLLASCSRRARQYESPPDSINLTADLEANALQRALSLQKMTAERDINGYRIGPNDILDIKVFENDGMNLSTRVGGNGVINFPPLGDLQAGGLSERELEKLLEDRLRGDYIPVPHVTVFVREIQARMFGIIGAVNLPGQYSSFGPMHLADLISKAGGLKPEVGDVAYIIRYNQHTDANPALTLPDEELSSDSIKIDLEGLLLRGQEQWNVALQPSDLVNIPTAGMVFITGGGIRKPGTYALTNKMTLQQLVDLAEGLKFEANRRLLLVRADERNVKRIFEINYDQLRASRVEDIQLRSSDKVIVDRTLGKTILASIGRATAQVFRVMVSANYRVEEDENNSNQE